MLKAKIIYDGILTEQHNVAVWPMLFIAVTFTEVNVDMSNPSKNGSPGNKEKISFCSFPDISLNYFIQRQTLNPRMYFLIEMALALSIVEAIAQLECSLPRVYSIGITLCVEGHNHSVSRRYNKKAYNMDGMCGPIVARHFQILQIHKLRGFKPFYGAGYTQGPLLLMVESFK